MRLWTQVRFAFQKQEARGRATDKVAEPFLTSYLLSLTSKTKSCTRSDTALRFVIDMDYFFLSWRN